MIFWGENRAEYLEDDPKGLKKCLGYIGITKDIPKFLGKLQESLERYYALEKRSLEKFGKPKTFRIWRVDTKTIQIDFKGGYSELGSKAKSDTALRRCLEEMGASQLLLGELKRELAEFLKSEELNPNVSP